MHITYKYMVSNKVHVTTNTVNNDLTTVFYHYFQGLSKYALLNVFDQNMTRYFIDVV